MPKIETTVDVCELLEYAEENGIAYWNEACDLVYKIQARDGAGSVYIEVGEFEEPSDYYPDKLRAIVTGFAAHYDAEYKTGLGFTLVNS